MLAIWAAEALLMALVLKLKVSSALADSETPPVFGTYKVKPAGCQLCDDAMPAF